MNAIQDTVMTVDTARKVLSVVDQGLCDDLGKPIPGQMCVQAAVCYALGLPHDDDPNCVDPPLRLFVITHNDAPWSSPKARAEGMRELAVAQLGSLGKLDSIQFVQKLAEQTIRRLLPPILRQVGLNDAADRCEQEGTQKAANAAYTAANAAIAANAAYTARYAACSARYAAYAADAARLAPEAAHSAALAARNAAFVAEANARDGVLTLMCDICIDVLREMGAPGIALMDQVC